MPRKKSVKTLIARTKISKDFYSDIDLPEMNFATLIRSPKSSGLFAGLNIPEMPEGYSIFTAKDIPGSKTANILGTEIPIFCSGRVQYEGEPIAILVGPDETKVQEIKNKIHVILHDANESSIDNNPLKKELKTGEALKSSSDFEILFESADRQIKETWTYEISAPTFSEPEGAVCFIEKGIFHVCTATKWMSNLRSTLASVLDIQSDKIEVFKTRSQPYSNNGDWRNSITAAQAGIAAIKIGKPVKLCFSQEEQLKIVEQTHPLTAEYRTALDKTGKISAMQIDIQINIGAVNPFAEEFLNRLIIGSCGVYNIKNLCISATAHRSRLPPSSQNSENISTMIFFCIESQINKIAEITGILPGELRIKNICVEQQKNFMPFKLMVDAPEETLQAVEAACDFKRKFVTYRIDYLKRQNNFSTTERFPLRGIGLACAFNGSGYYGNSIYSNDQKMEATLEVDGSLTIHGMPTSNSILEIWKETAATILDLDVAKININSVFESDEEPLLPESVYSNLSVMTQLLKKCCIAIQKKRFKNPLPISVTKSILPIQKKQWKSETFTGQPFHSSSFVSAVVELELDPCTFKCSLRGVWVIIDSGKILIDTEAQNRVNLEINQSLCKLLSETKLDSRKISISFIHSQKEPKQLHGLIANVIPAAFSSALSQAISESIQSIPISEESLFLKGAFKPEDVLDHFDILDDIDIANLEIEQEEEEGKKQ